jgi:hypothetical protein
MVLASMRLEEMFGYQHAELSGRPIRAIIPVGLQEQAARSAGAGAWPAGLRDAVFTAPGYQGPP